MTQLLNALAYLVQHRPRSLVVVVGVITVVLGVFATQQQAQVDITAFAPETDLAAAFARVQDDFATTGATVQVIIDADDGGDVLSPDGLQVAQQITDAATASPTVAPLLAEPGGLGPPVISFASGLLGALEQQGLDPSSVPPNELDSLSTQVFASPDGAQLAGLLSRDRDLEAGSARAGIVLIQLDATSSESAQRAAGVALRDLLEDLTFPDGMEVLAFSQGILFAELESGLQDQLPFLLGLSLLLIVLILGLIYRSVSDVVLGLAGLVLTVVWMYGFGVLLGPDYLGITGAFSQISIVIPVLLVGLGVDYAIHLTSRYREELAEGAGVDEAARMAVVSVGGALVLATATTIIGFVTNWFTPLPPIRDFGLFTAFGVLSAFVVMATLVPATRHLLDRRRTSTVNSSVAARGGRGQGPLALSRGMARLAVLTERAPGVTLCVAALVTAVAAVGASQLSTSFSQDDFIPEGSYADVVLARAEMLFGGDLTEQTHVLVEGDFTDPEVANAVLAAELAIDEVDPTLIRRGLEGAQVSSAPGVVARLAGRAAAAGAGPSSTTDGGDTAALQAALRGNGWVDGAFAADADMLALYRLVEETAPGEIERLLADDAQAGLLTLSSTAGEDDVDELVEALQPALELLGPTTEDVVVVSEQMVIAEVINAMTASQVRSILITLVAALVLLTGYYGMVNRRPLLGPITMVPSVLSVSWVLGSMYLLGLSFNVLTSTVAALAIGIGVPYGIHITHRFTEDRELATSTEEAMRSTVMHTGGALAASAATTAVGFGVLVFSELIPIQQFGGVTALTIVFALAGSVLVQPSLLAVWDRRQRRKSPHRPLVEASP